MISLQPSSSEDSSSLSLVGIFSQHVYSSHKIYKSLQSQENSDDEFLNAVRRSSIEFRQSANEFVRVLTTFAEEFDESGDTRVEAVDWAIDIVNDAQKLWHITEFFVVCPSHTVCQDTISWLQVAYILHLLNIRTNAICALQGMIEDSDYLPYRDLLEHYSICPEQELSDLNNDSDSQFRGGFWGVVFDLILRGKLAMAWGILQTHSEIKSLPPRNHKLLALKRLFTEHPFCVAEDGIDDRSAGAAAGEGDDHGYGGIHTTGTSARENSALWMEWRQVSVSLNLYGYNNE